MTASQPQAALGQAFFPDGRNRIFMLANLGHADPAAPRPRHPRFDFDAVARIL